MILPRLQHRIRRAGYTLIEVVASAAVIAVGMAGATSLSSTIMAQQDLTWRVSVARNYQENMARLWQIGLSPAEVIAIMPTASGNPLLSEVVGGSPTIVSNGQINEDNLGVVESASISFSINTSNVPGAGAGSTNVVDVYRPTLR